MTSPAVTAALLLTEGLGACARVAVEHRVSLRDAVASTMFQPREDTMLICFICGEPSKLVKVEGRDSCAACCEACESAEHSLEECLTDENEPEEFVDMTTSLGLWSPWS